MLHKIIPSYFFLSLIFIFAFPIISQSQCPGCQISLPGNLVADTIYLDTVPTGSVNSAYTEDVSFRLPKTTTPVAANDSTIQGGITLDEIRILYISNLPPGLEWETNEDVYFPADETDGCVKICGTPLAPGIYVLDIVLEVKVLFITQESTFQRTIEILPSTTVNDGFTMTNSAGCGEVTVSFDNNVPSNGNSGISYEWDFGNGNTSSNENPSDQTYSTPGTYAVDYQAVIDTSGHTLTKIRVIESDCADIFGGAPDIYLDIIDPNGNSTVTASIDNTDPPVEFNFNMPLIDGNYTLVVKDEDGGLGGLDDECDFYSFNKFSNGILINGSSSVELTILHPVDTIRTTDSVYVYPVPDQPQLSYEMPLSWCEGENVIFNSSYSTNNQWMLNGLPINGATESFYQALETGFYSVVYTNSFGCSAESEVVEIILNALPAEPIFNGDDNILAVVVVGNLPADYSLQWYYENTLLPGETELTYCMIQSGNYTLEVTDNATGCTNTFSSDEIFNPAYNCGVLGIEDLSQGSLKIYPNPFRDNLHIQFSLNENSDFKINVIDLLGRRIELDSKSEFGGEFNQTYSFSDWNAGVYLLEIDFGDERIYQKIVLQK
ncbi:MAG: T9SS type A sorting domain-containing protein [Saprospiraceae bacterium]